MCTCRSTHQAFTLRRTPTAKREKDDTTEHGAVRGGGHHGWDPGVVPPGRTMGAEPTARTAVQRVRPQTAHPGCPRCRANGLEQLPRLGVGTPANRALKGSGCAHFQHCSREPRGGALSFCGQSSLVKARRKL